MTRPTVRTPTRAVRSSASAMRPATRSVCGLLLSETVCVSIPPSVCWDGESAISSRFVGGAAPPLSPLGAVARLLHPTRNEHEIARISATLHFVIGLLPRRHGDGRVAHRAVEADRFRPAGRPAGRCRKSWRRVHGVAATYLQLRGA